MNWLFWKLVGMLPWAQIALVGGGFLAVFLLVLYCMGYARKLLMPLALTLVLLPGLGWLARPRMVAPVEPAPVAQGPGILESAGGGAGRLAEGAGEMVKGAGEGAGRLADGLGDGAGQLLEGAGDGLGKLAEGAGKAISGVIKSVSEIPARASGVPVMPEPGTVAHHHEAVKIVEDEHFCAKMALDSAKEKFNQARSRQARDYWSQETDKLQVAFVIKERKLEAAKAALKESVERLKEAEEAAAADEMALKAKQEEEARRSNERLRAEHRAQELELRKADEAHNPELATLREMKERMEALETRDKYFDKLWDFYSKGDENRQKWQLVSEERKKGWEEMRVLEQEIKALAAKTELDELRYKLGKPTP